MPGSSYAPGAPLRMPEAAPPSKNAWRRAYRSRNQAISAPRAELVAGLKTFFPYQGALVLRQLRARLPQLREDAAAGGALADAIWDQIQEDTTRMLAVQFEVGMGAALAGGLAQTRALYGVATDLTHPRAVQWMEGRGAARSALIQDATRREMRELLVTAAEAGWSYQRTAGAIQREFSGYSAGRAHLIAVTELGEAYEAGNQIGALNLQVYGHRVVKAWSHSHDARVTPGCLANGAAGWIDVEARFPSGHMHPLRHVRCRCACVYESMEATGRDGPGHYLPEER